MEKYDGKKQSESVGAAPRQCDLENRTKACSKELINPCYNFKLPSSWPRN